jgi:hypothetical protein
MTKVDLARVEFAFHTIRIASEHASDPASLKDLLHEEDLKQRLWPS